MSAIKKNAQQVHPEANLTSVDTGNNKGTVKMSTAVRNTQQVQHDTNNTPVDTGEGKNACSTLAVYRWDKIDVSALPQQFSALAEAHLKDRSNTPGIAHFRRGRIRKITIEIQNPQSDLVIIDPETGKEFAGAIYFDIDSASPLEISSRKKGIKAA